MGIGSGKRAAAKAERTPAKTRSSASKQIKTENSPTTTPPRSTGRTRSGGRERSFSSSLPTNTQKRSNGRVVGRSLIVWGRPRMAEKLLLHIQYECNRHKVHIPWDAAAHRLHPGSSGAAIQQHLNRLRRELAAEGHMVPPLCSRISSGDNTDPEIRGYIRDESQVGNLEAIRPVKFGETIEDRKFNLPGAYLDDDEATEAEEYMIDQEHEDGERIDHSPTPLSRSQRQKRAARGFLYDPAHPESMNGSPISLPQPTAGGSGHGSDLAEALFHSPGGMLLSPDHKGGPNHANGYGAGATHGLIPGGMYGGFPLPRNPDGSDRHHGLHGYRDPFLGHGRPVPQEGAALDEKYPLGIPPWDTAYTLHNTYYPAHGMDNGGEKTDSISQGHPFSTDPRTEASQTETMATSFGNDRSANNLDFKPSQSAEHLSFDDAAAGETHMDDFIDGNHVDVSELIEPEAVLKRDSLDRD